MAAIGRREGRERAGRRYPAAGETGAPGAAWSGRRRAFP